MSSVDSSGLWKRHGNVVRKNGGVHGNCPRIDGGWLSVFEVAERSGSALLNLEVPDLDEALAQLKERGLTAGPVQAGGTRTRFAALEDPDGNRVTLLENPVA